MKSRRFKTGVLVLTGAAIAGGGLIAAPAQAYPPGQQMTCSTSEPWSTKPLSFNVNITQGRPGATAHVHVSTHKKQSTEQYGTFDENGNATVTVTMNKWASKHAGAVRIMVAVPGYDYFEKCHSTVVIHKHTVDAPDHTITGKGRTVTAHGFRPWTDITFTAVRGDKRIVKTGQTDGSGNCTMTLDLPRRGRWTIVATSGHHVATTEVTVGKTRSPKRSGTKSDHEKSSKKSGQKSGDRSKSHDMSNVSMKSGRHT